MEKNGKETKKVSELIMTEEGWEEIDVLAARAIKENWFPEAYEKGYVAYVKMRLRQMASRKNPDTGLPELASIEVPAGDGEKTKRVYKQLDLFNPDDYKQVYIYHSKRSDHHRKLAKTYAEDCYKRFNVRIESGQLELKYYEEEGENAVYMQS